MGQALAWIVGSLVLACCASRSRVEPPSPALVVVEPPRVAPPAAEAPLPALTASPDFPGGQRMRVRRVNESADAGCAAFDPAMLGACRAIPTRTPDASGDTNARAASAFDGDRCSVWNSGGAPPQALRARLGATADPDARVSAIILVPEMLPNGQTMHALELGGGPADEKVAIQAALETNATYVVAFDRPIAARTLTVRSLRSPSWIAWREIIPVTCDGAPDLTALAEVTPPTPRPPDKRPENIFVRGRGRCNGIGCSQNVVQGTLDTGECRCENHHCGAMVRAPAERGGGLL